MQTSPGEGEGGDEVDEMLEKYINDSAGTAVQKIGGARAENGTSSIRLTDSVRPSQLTDVCVVVFCVAQVASQTTCSCWSAPGSPPAGYFTAHPLGTVASRSFS